MIDRIIAPHIISLLNAYPVVTLTGPRQSGKTTLARNLLSDWEYVSLEDPEMREFCKSDCKGFLKTFPGKTIIDEAQRVPELFSYLQTNVDFSGKNGMYVLSGSQNIMMMKSISQSLAGRTGLVKLFPFSYEELRAGSILPKSVNEQIFTGGYPRIYDKKIEPVQFYKDYIELYVERDVRELKNIGDLSTFIKFIKLCAGRIGQLLNITNLADDCGISATTAKSWLSILETSFIIYFLQPDYRNFSKRIVKTPKLYFCDTGLACSLLEMKNANQLESHYLRGSLFENLVINRFRTRYFNANENPALTFWRDKIGTEIDLFDSKLDESGKEKIYAYEIKSGSTFSADYFKNLKRLTELSSQNSDFNTVVYNGDKKLFTKDGILCPWNELF